MGATEDPDRVGDDGTEVARKKPGPAPALSPEQVARMIGEYREGASAESLGAQYGVTGSTVRRTLELAGEPIRSRHQAVSDRLPEQEVAAKYREGASIQALAKTYGVSASALAKLLTRLGVPRRGRSTDSLPTAEIVSAYESGATTRYLGSQYGVGADAINKLLRDSGVSLRPTGSPRAMTDEQVVAARDLHAQGKTYREVAAALGVSHSAVSKRLRDVGASTSTGLRALTEHQREQIRDLTAQGLAAAEIGRRLNIPSRTVLRVAGPEARRKRKS
ncbi:helix-turn-helix domain-containing protein [Streptomyces sp. NBC_01435]|uniref:helix-turn-helix domain-containing protein n=1 Tax=Streptomyces sp. NBC_01435 TaxID=2903865 RepID=UPI002E335DB1|nr:helix-turn-helix domain-containing protein [Streptomyces sp. NBC_01435]